MDIDRTIIQYGKVLGKVSRGARYSKYKYVECRACNKGRWVAIHNLERSATSGLCRHCCTARERNYNWKGGRAQDGRGEGYIRVHLPPNDFFYPMASKTGGGVLEHRLVMARHLGRNLHSWEIVHHRGIRYTGIANRSDNLIDNLQLVTDDRHKQISVLERKIESLQAENAELKRKLELHGEK